MMEIIHIIEVIYDGDNIRSEDVRFDKFGTTQQGLNGFIAAHPKNDVMEMKYNGQDMGLIIYYGGNNICCR